MSHYSSDALHLKGVTFEIHYPPSPFHPRTPIYAQFSGVLNPDGRLHAKLDSGSIPGSCSSPGIPIHGSFTVDPKEAPRRFSGFLSNDRINAEAR